MQISIRTRSTISLRTVVRMTDDKRTSGTEQWEVEIGFAGSGRVTHETVEAHNRASAMGAAVRNRVECNAVANDAWRAER